ncbi:hypothetical protein TSUD_407540 [Trifolium subterraneum]|uniref:Reverse transcriptase domain-containing protein n=1 Tax=Trifolium subterraneum TaxID=3900 RepID=A0A2Z6NZA2_TRISU|nr:hypothetical protein TSUD_407540 [Trifolium subterraneum]
MKRKTDHGRPDNSQRGRLPNTDNIPVTIDMPRQIKTRVDTFNMKDARHGTTEGDIASSVGKDTTSMHHDMFLCLDITTHIQFLPMDDGSRLMTTFDGDQRNVTKMTKFLNPVWFGHFCVCGKVAKFERNDTKEDGIPKKEKVGLLKSPDEALKKNIELEEAANNAFHGKSDVEFSDKQDVTMSGEGASEGEGERTGDILSPICDQAEVHSTIRLGPEGDAGDRDLRTGSKSQQSEPQDCPTTRTSFGESRRDAGNKMHNNRANSCPPAASRSVISGPWSLDWLHDHDHGEAGVIFSARKRGKEEGRHGMRHKKMGQLEPKRRKAGGLLRHPLHMFSDDERGLIVRDPRIAKLLQKNLHRRIPLTMIGRTGWLCKEMSRQSWMMLRGSIHPWGLKFKGDNANMFDVLSRARKSKKERSGHQQGEVRRRRDGVCLMKIISWNVRGLCGLEKRKEVLKLVGDLNPLILCLQVTKLQTCEDFLCSTLWGNPPHTFSYRPSVGASGGLLTIWDSSEVEVWSTESRDHVLWCHGRFTKSREDFSVANVYAPCDDGAKQGLCESLSALIQSLGRRRVCVCGDFNLLNKWMNVALLRVFVKDKWKSLQVDGWGGYVLKEKLRMIKAALKYWHTTHTQNLPTRIESLKVRLSTLDQKGDEEVLSEAEIVELHGVSSDNHSLSRMNASISWQQSSSLWLKEGDTNSKYFHSAVFSHFASHFKRLNQLESSTLTKPFLEDDVKAAVCDCDSYKSQRPDGGNFGFIKDFWVELRGDVMRFISEFHKNGKLTKGINSTFIAPIPKIDSPQRPNDFRPISLVGSLYKILAKVLANRLRLVIGSVISESQTTFVDFEKTYDSVDWGYLDDVMGRMSFPALWRKWIKECVCTATASVLVNGSPIDEFLLERGLKQGDPLSPFLFLLASDGLNVLMEAAVARNLFTGYVLVSEILFRCRIFSSPTTRSCWEQKIVWVEKPLSFGGRLVLLKSVLISPPVYALSFFKAPSGKWCWRLLVDREGLWCRVLAARYGVERGRLRDGGRRGSVWWREIARIREGGQLGGSWFGEHVSKRVEDGSDSFFWTDPWMEGIHLCERFGRLFDLAGNKLCTVAEMFSLGWGADGDAWEWRRKLWEWEEMLRECQTLLLNLSLQAQSSDRWQWQPDADEGYTVRGAYQLLTSQASATMDDADKLIWHSQVPLKVSIFSWRLLRDRLPTKTNLVARGILFPVVHFCVSGCEAAESAHHLFISCSTFGSLWTLVYSWIDITLVHSTSIRDHFVQFTCSASVSRA